MYKVDYPEFGFKSTKREYEAGEIVEVVFYFVATDTSYTFRADVEDLKEEYENGCIVLRFTMPEHDVKIAFESRNVMAYKPNEGNALTGFMGMMNVAGGVSPKGEAGKKEIKNGTEDKFCRICGEKRINHAKFCTACGAGFGI